MSLFCTLTTMLSFNCLCHILCVHNTHLISRCPPGTLRGQNVTCSYLSTWTNTYLKQWLPFSLPHPSAIYLHSQPLLFPAITLPSPPIYLPFCWPTVLCPCCPCADQLLWLLATLPTFYWPSGHCWQLDTITASCWLCTPSANLEWQAIFYLFFFIIMLLITIIIIIIIIIIRLLQLFCLLILQSDSTLSTNYPPCIFPMEKKMEIDPWPLLNSTCPVLSWMHTSANSVCSGDHSSFIMFHWIVKLSQTVCILEV